LIYTLQTTAQLQRTPSPEASVFSRKPALVSDVDELTNTNKPSTDPHSSTKTDSLVLSDGTEGVEHLIGSLYIK
jgi:hypothetical protein